MTTDARPFSIKRIDAYLLFKTILAKKDLSDFFQDYLFIFAGLPSIDAKKIRMYAVLPAVFPQDRR